ncbi:mandelate racemase/muconate lactonizing enzyme family protein [Aeoliella sp.]|uniref:mandelate racemase/muconate lactonizing enzyme family protein n=1 Tax=Aeoliella sp. TaxID=2795800 RepID=UPI003CCBB100
MKITDVRCVLLSAPYATPDDAERVLHLKTGFRPAGLIRVEASDGSCGYGEVYSGVYAPETVAALTNQLGEAIQGQDARRPATLWERMRLASYYWGRLGISQSVIGGIEMALWDLHGKSLGVPVCDLLGGRTHDALLAYASGGNNKPEDELRAEMRGYVEDGFRAVKIRINNLPGVDEIVQKVGICREALGPDVGLAVDAAQGLARRPWTVKQATTIAKTIEQFDLMWIEEPAEVANYDGFAEIRRNISIPVAGGETVTSLTEAESYLKADALDLFQPDASLIGGLSVFRKLADLCDRRQIPVAVHTWSAGVGIMGNYHAAFASRNCSIVELPSVPNPLREAVLAEPLRLVEGKVPAPTSAGLGLTVPDDLESQYPYQPGTYYKILGATDRQETE